MKTLLRNFKALWKAVWDSFEEEDRPIPPIPEGGNTLRKKGKG